MEGPGRRSVNARGTVVNLVPVQRSEPANYLSADEAAVWRKIVASQPPDYFGAETHHLLESLCRHVAMMQWLDSTRLPVLRQQGKDAEVRAWLAEMREESKLIKMLSTSLRITNRSKYQARGAWTASKRGGPKPWDN